MRKDEKGFYREVRRLRTPNWQVRFLSFTHPSRRAIARMELRAGGAESIMRVNLWRGNYSDFVAGKSLANRAPGTAAFNITP
jgi:hypothetical protein